MKIVKRRIDFDFDPKLVPRDWYRGDVHLTTFWNALSLLFPEGERFFVEAVRHYKDRITEPELLAQVDAFVAQEAMHGKQHRAFNDMVRERGLGVAGPAEQRLKRLLVFAKRTLSPKRRLAVTCALEHFTAIMAEQLLAQEDHRDAGHESVRNLWVWHALEEAEHKAVAFDVYRAVGGTYRMRAAIMVVTSVIFFAEQFNVHARFLRAEGELWNVRGWTRAMDYFWLRPGLFRKLAPAYLDYFRPGFHPEDRDTRALIHRWRETLFGEGGELREKLHAA